MAAYGLYSHIQANKRRSVILLIGLFATVYFMVYAGALLAEALSYDASLDYLRMTNRSPEQIELVEAYAREQGLFRIDGAPDPVYSDTLGLDLSTRLFCPGCFQLQE